MAKKGNVEVDRWRDDASQYRIFIKSKVLIVPRQDLKDLHELIQRTLWPEGYESQPLTEGEKGYNFETNSVRMGMLRQWLNEDRIDSPKKMVTNEQLEYWLQAPIKEHLSEDMFKELECEHPNELQQLGIDKDERGTLYCVKCGYYRLSKPQQESNKEEETTYDPERCQFNMVGQEHHVTPHTCNGLYEVSGWAGGSPQEPSKKPREIITEKTMELFKDGYTLDNSRIEAVIDLLDELHNQGKI